MNASTPVLSSVSFVIARLRAAIAWADRMPSSVLGLIVRTGIALVFWRSGQTKVSGWHVTDITVQLFRDEYKVPILSPEVAATLAAVQEHLFSALLILGLFSRLSALGLLLMTAVIEIFVYPENWAEHLLWAGSLLYVIGRGPGAFSADEIIRRYFRKTTSAKAGASYY